jgi:hypothetical protein
LALGLTLFAGVVTDVVASSQVLALAGPDALLWLYPISGIGLAVPAILLVPVIDKWPRLPMLRAVGLGFAAAFVAGLIGLVAAYTWWPDSPLLIVVVGFLWILASLQNYLLPVLLWSLSADVFNVNESRQVNGWIASWTYFGRLAALALTVVSPVIFARAGIALPWLFVIAPTVTVFISLWLPHRMRSAGAATGLIHVESARESLASGWSFVREVRVWWWLLVASVVTFSAGSALSLGISAASELIIGADAATLQMYLGGIQLLAVLISLLVQRFVARPATARLGINGTLLILPISVILSALLLGAGLATASLWLVAGAALLWRVPSWTVDTNARTAVLGFVPDQRRARVGLIMVLATYALTWVFATPIAAPGLLTSEPWLLGAVPAVVAVCALFWWVKVYRHWNESMLNWRLRRRKHGTVQDLAFDDE